MKRKQDRRAVWTPADDRTAPPGCEVITDGIHYAVTFNFPIPTPQFQKNQVLPLADGTTVRVSIAPPTEFALEPFWYRLVGIDGQIFWYEETQLIERLAK